MDGFSKLLKRCRYPELKIMIFFMSIYMATTAQINDSQKIEINFPSKQKL